MMRASLSHIPNFRRLLPLLLTLLLPLALLAQQFPERTDRLVNDFTGTLSAQESAELTALLEGYERESSIEIAIVIISTLDGYEISQYTFDLGEKWGIGKGGTDNGALLLVSRGDRKMWIATGYGLEGALPDALVSRIITNDILPRFKQDDYFGGLKAGALAIMQATKGEYVGTPRASSGGSVNIFLVMGIMLVIFLFVWGIKAAQVKEYARVNHLSFWAAWALLNSATSRHSGSYRHFSGGGSGFSGGGGGGFGGFGGGSFGGGGAGGSW
jgi:uncharacterized protein